MPSRQYRDRAEPPTEWAPVEVAPPIADAGRGEQRPEPAPAVLGLGIPLTDTVAFSSADGMRWVAYVEGFPRESPRFPPRRLLPGRRVRFDSEAGSWVSEEVPAGSPFLDEARLRALLRRAQPLSFQEIQRPTPIAVLLRRQVAERLERASRWTRAASGAALRYWREDGARVAERLQGALARMLRRV